MSVPAFKNSRSKVRRRRSHHALKPVQLLKDKVTGEYSRHHHAEVVAPVKEVAAKPVKKTEKAPKSVSASAKGGKAKPVKAAKTEEKKK